MGRTAASSHWPCFGTLLVSLEAGPPEMRAWPAAPRTEEAAGKAGAGARRVLPGLPMVGLNVSEWEMLWEFKEAKHTNISWWCYYCYYYLWRSRFQEGRGRFVPNCAWWGKVCADTLGSTRALTEGFPSP